MRIPDMLRVGRFKFLCRLEECMKLKVILEKQLEGGYTVYVHSLPGCISQGETRREAIKNIKEAIELYLEEGSDEVSGGIVAMISI